MATDNNWLQRHLNSQQDDAPYYSENASQNRQWQSSSQNASSNTALQYSANENATQNRQWQSALQSNASTNDALLQYSSNENAHQNRQWQSSPSHNSSSNNVALQYLVNENAHQNRQWQSPSHNSSSNNAVLQYSVNENAPHNRSLSNYSPVNSALHLISSDYATPNRSISRELPPAFLPQENAPQSRKFSSDISLNGNNENAAAAYVASQNRLQPSRAYASNSDMTDPQIPSQFECSLVENLGSSSNVATGQSSSLNQTALPEIWSQLPPAAQRNDFKAKERSPKCVSSVL